MLLSLSLENFVLVEKLNLDFQEGFTVLSGESGAGKSITLDAIGLLLGDKADFSKIRHNEQEARISALFDIGSLPSLQKKLKNEGYLDDTSKEINIRRIIDIKGKSRNFINNQTTTLSQLKQIGEQLIAIHGQNTHHTLNQESQQRHLLDSYAETKKQVRKVAELYNNWKYYEKKLLDAQVQAEHSIIERERLEWQLNELNQLNIQEGEWESLNKNFDTLSHAADIINTAEKTINIINRDDGIQSQINLCQKYLESFLEIEPKFNENYQLLSSIEAELSEISSNMRHLTSYTEINPNELIHHEQRLNEIMSIAKKYKVEPQHIMHKLNDIKLALDTLEASSDLEHISSKVEESKHAYFSVAENLSATRSEAAKKLQQETLEKIKVLSMPNAQFTISITPSPPTSYVKRDQLFQQYHHLYLNLLRQKLK